MNVPTLNSQKKYVTKSIVLNGDSISHVKITWLMHTGNKTNIISPAVTTLEELFFFFYTGSLST